MPEDHGDLLHAECGEHALVAEHAAAAVLARKDLRLQRQKRAGRIDEVHDRQPVLDRDVERAYRFRNGARIHGTTLDRAVAGDHHHLAAADHADADDQGGLRHLAIVGATRGERGQLEERRTRVEQQVEPLAHEQLLQRAQPVDVALRPLVPRRVLTRAQLLRELQVVRAVGLVRRGAGVDVRLDAAHDVTKFLYVRHMSFVVPAQAGTQRLLTKDAGFPRSRE